MASIRTAVRTYSTGTITLSCWGAGAVESTGNPVTRTYCAGGRLNPFEVYQPARAPSASSR